MIQDEPAHHVSVEGNATVTIKNIVGTGQPQGVSVYLTIPTAFGVTTAVSRTATYSVNGGPPITLKQRSGSAGIILSQPMNITFNAGGGNTLTFAGYNGGAASDLNKIVVYGNIYDD